MKVMILADLHMNGKYDIAMARRHVRPSMDGDVDAVVICGDIFEANYQCNPYKQLTKIFENDVPVICVLGNHEFFDRTINETIKYYEGYYNPDKYNVHYLDIIGHYDMGVYRFFGNALWYDGSMATRPNQDPNVFEGKDILERQDREDQADPVFYPNSGESWAWADRYIENFDCIKANKVCIEQIKTNKGNDTQINILCTHCCPHKDLNLHLDNVRSPYNAFSGVADLLGDIQPDYAFCGHTHKRIVGKYIGNTKCVNVGNDLHEFQYLTIDI